MKNLLLISFLILVFATPGWCYTVGLTDVGNLDEFLGSSSGTGDEDDQTKWVNDVLVNYGVTATYHVRNEDVEYFSTNEQGIFAFEMSSPYSDYFLIKNSTFWALFGNADHMGWGVFAADQLPSGMNIPSDDFQISHVTLFNTAPVPEPATILLIGAGLAGLGFQARRRGKR